MQTTKCYECQQQKPCGIMWVKMPPDSRIEVDQQRVCGDCWEKVISTIGVGCSKAEGYAGGGTRVVRGTNSLT